MCNKKLNCRRQTARCFVPLNISPSYSRSYSAPDNSVTLKSGLGVLQCHWKWYHSKACGCGFLFAFIINMALSHISSETKRDIGWNLKIAILSYHPCSRCPVRGSPYKYCYTVQCRKSRIVWLATVKKFDSTFSRFNTIPACDIGTDGRTSYVAMDRITR